MYANRLIDFLRYLLGRPRQVALEPVRMRLLFGIALVPSVLMLAQAAKASVLATGSYSPADNPFTLNVNEGIPSDGNFIDPFQLPGAGGASYQTRFEGRHSDGANPSDPVDDTNINFDIVIGVTSFGSLLISGESALRDQDLVIGDSGLIGGEDRVGTGVVRITGFGSLYNNDPSIVPAEVQAAIDAGYAFRSVNPRDAAIGFDLLVGNAGTGTLEITAGARAEIQDAVIVGNAPGSIGNLIVDGMDSFLGSGGFEAESGDGGGDESTGNRTDLHEMIVGYQGTGMMTVSGGGSVNSEAPPEGSGGGNQAGPVGAVIGSAPYTLTQNEAPDTGGNGTVTVTGAGSKWRIGGTLQIGGFDIATSGGSITTGGDIEGDDTQYGSQAGRGTLVIKDGGFVQVSNAIGASSGGTGQDTPLFVAIGRFGIVSLDGGTMQIGGMIGGQQNEATPDSVILINDGLIKGTGRINTGVFRNRYLGEVRVDAGQSLVIDSSSEFSTSVGQTPVEAISNFGKIQVLGNSQVQAYLEIIRSPAESEASNTVRPFVNLPLTDPPATSPAFTGGLISGQYSTMRFGSGLENRSLVAFTAGMNYVSGRVVNLLPEATGGGGIDPLPVTQMLVSGAGTTALFEDDLAFGTGTHLNLVDGGKVVVLNEHSFTLSGDLSMTLSYNHPSLITVSGDVGIGQGSTALTLNLASDALNSLTHGDAFQLITFGGQIGNVNVSDPLSPVPDLAGNPIFSSINVSPDIFNLYGLVTQIQFAPEGVYAVFLDPTQVGPGSGAVGPDFNGDGVINSLDFAIWQAHFGIASGASVLDGDADGDGDVDGADFLFWQRNVGKPMPWTGSGAGAGLGGGSEMASVPEPTSLAMMACCGSLALGLIRRRTR